MNAPGLYLRQYLSVLAPYLKRPDVTDLYINRPEELWVETLGGKIERHDVSALNEATIERLIGQVAAYAHQGINRESPLLSASLPDGARIQVVAPPATRGPIAIAVRKQVMADMTLDDYTASGAFNAVRPNGQNEEIRDKLKALREEGAFAELLRLAVKARLNILISGGTAVGKTTFLNALIREVPLQERLVVIEDTQEVLLPHPNSVSMLAARNALGEADVSMEDLLSASLRMRPDRIILGELRGPEALTFLRAVNTGHPGSITTIHADSPERAVEQLALLILQAGTKLSRSDVQGYVRSSIDVFVQLRRVDGERVITQVELAA